MSVFWLVLKIIAFVLLSVLALVLLLLAALLFVPFRYEADVHGNKEGPEVQAIAKVRWLLRIVSVRYDFDLKGDSGLVIRLFGIPIKKSVQKKEEKDSEKKEESEKKEDSDQTEEGKNSESTEAEKKEEIEKESEKETEKESENEDEKAEEQPVSLSEETSGNDAENDSVAHSVENRKDDEASSEEASGADAEEAEASETTSDDGKEEKKGLFGRIKDKAGSVKNTVSDKAGGIKKKIKDLWDSVRAMLVLFSKKKGLLVAYINKKSTKAALKTAWDNLFWVLKHIAPKKYNGSLEVGLEDPALTGEIFAAISPVYGFVADHLVIVPAFENRMVVDGDAYVKGRIRLWGIVIRAIRIYRDKNIRKVIKEAEKVKDTLTNTPNEIKDCINKAA